MFNPPTALFMISSSSSLDDIRLLAETYAAAEEMLGIGTWQFNLDTGHIQYSNNLFRIFGFEPGAIEPSLENFLKLIHPDDLSLVQNQVATLFQTKEPKPNRYRIVWADGTVRHIRGTGRMVKTESGHHVVVGTSQDVTEEHRLRFELSERSRLLESVTDRNTDIITVLDRDGIILLWNRAAEFHYDKRRDEITGKHIFDVFPEQRGSVADVWMQRVMNGEEMFIPEGKFSTRDGYYQMHLFPLHDADNVVVGMLSIIHDITDEYHLRKQLLERGAFVESLVDNLPLMIAAFDKDLNYTAWNNATEQLYGLKREAVLGKNMLELLPGMRNTDIHRYVEKAFAGETIHRQDAKYQSFDGYYDNYLVPIRGNDGSVNSVISIGVDITARKRNEERIEQQNAELKRINRELSSFAYVASHDLKEPLRKIQVFAGRLLEKEADQLSTSGKDYFKRMQSAAGRMDALIEDLLSFSRINSMDQTFEDADLNELLEQAKTDLAVIVAEAGASVLSSGLPRLRVIPFQIRQLFQNLLSNSIKFQQPGLPPVIRVSAAEVQGSTNPFAGAASNKTYVVISVRDNGIGFDRQFSERIFDLFQRLHGREAYAGTGIGLSICKKIAENHNGTVTADGEPGKGATFNIFLQA